MPILITSALFALSCNTSNCADDELELADGTCVPWGETDDTQITDDTDDTDVGPVVLPDTCVAPSDLGQDPLIERGNVFKGEDTPSPEPFAEIVDLELLNANTLLGVGQGGLMTYDVSDPDNPGFYNFHPTDTQGRFHRVEPLDDGHIVVVHRDFTMEFLDMSDPANPDRFREEGVSGVEGLLWHDGVLWVTQRGEGIHVYERTGDRNYNRTDTIEGLATPWELSKPTTQEWSYVADSTLGLVPFDLNARAFGDAVELSAAPLHVAVQGDFVYVALGGHGVAILDASSPNDLTQVAQVETSGSAVEVWVDDDLLWVADHSGVAVFDVSDPSAPVPIGREITEQFALGMYSSGTLGYVGDWNYMRILEVFPDAGTPDADWSTDAVHLDQDGEVRTVTVTNMGRGTLELTGATVPGDNLSVIASTDSLASGESGTLTLTFTGGSVSGNLCISSNDPDGAVTEIPLTSGVAQPPVGQDAPDFTVQGLDGNTYSVSEHLGEPIFLVFYASW
jgi:hypothetical protein